MGSKTEYVNMALGHLGQDATESIDLNSLPANRTAPRKMLVYADTALRVTLEDHDWLDAQVYVNLQSPLSLSGDATWAYIYGLPPGFIRVSELSGPAKWQVGLHIEADDTQRRVLYADAAISKCSCIVTPDWEMLPPSLGLAVSFKMAWLACVSVTGKDGLRPGLEDAYLGAMRDAARAEAWNHADDQSEVERLQDWRRTAL